MTTIAFDGNIIACDTQITMGNLIHNHKSKFYNLKGGAKAAMCGSQLEIDYFVNNFVDGEVCAQICSAGGIGFTKEDGLCIAYGFYVEDGYFRKVKFETSHADGSGRDFALAAMDHGKDAIEAVKYAMTRDFYTGGEVIAFDLELKRFL